MNTLEGMSAKKFLKEQIRMCKSYDNCLDCELIDDDGGCLFEMITTAENVSNTDINDVVNIVEKWSDDHSEHFEATLLSDALNRRSEFGLDNSSFGLITVNGKEEVMIKNLCPCELDYELGFMNCPCEGLFPGSIRIEDHCWRCWNRTLNEVK